MATNFAGAGASFGKALDFYREQQEKKGKQKLLQDTLAKWQSKAGALAPASPSLMQPPGGQPMGAELGMGQADIAPPRTAPGSPPPLGAGLPRIGGGIDELINPPAAKAPVPQAPDESLNLLMELSSAGVMPPENLFTYVANAGKLAQLQDGRVDVEKMKAELKKELQTEKLIADMEEIKAVIAGRKDVAGIGAGAKTAAAGISAEGRVNAAKVAAGGKPKSPAIMTPEEIDAELEYLVTQADSLGRAGMDPAKVGRKDAMKQGYRLDEAARQKDQSKVMDRVRVLTAQKRQNEAVNGLGMEPAADATTPPPGVKVYPSIGAAQRAMRQGKISGGQAWALNENGQPEIFNVR